MKKGLRLKGLKLYCYQFHFCAWKTMVLISWLYSFCNRTLFNQYGKYYQGQEFFGFALSWSMNVSEKLVILSQPVRLLWPKRSITFSYDPCVFCFNFLGSHSHKVFVILTFFCGCMAIISDFFWFYKTQSYCALKWEEQQASRKNYMLYNYKKKWSCYHGHLYIWYILFQTPEESWEKVEKEDYILIFFFLAYNLH